MQLPPHGGAAQLLSSVIRVDSPPRHFKAVDSPRRCFKPDLGTASRHSFRQQSPTPSVISSRGSPSVLRGSSVRRQRECTRDRETPSCSMSTAGLQSLTASEVQAVEVEMEPKVASSEGSLIFSIHRMLNSIDESKDHASAKVSKSTRHLMKLVDDCHQQSLANLLGGRASSMDCDWIRWMLVVVHSELVKLSEGGHLNRSESHVCDHALTEKLGAGLLDHHCADPWEGNDDLAMEDLIQYFIESLEGPPLVDLKSVPVKNLLDACWEREKRMSTGSSTSVGSFSTVSNMGRSSIGRSSIDTVGSTDSRVWSAVDRSPKGSFTPVSCSSSITKSDSKVVGAGDHSKWSTCTPSSPSSGTRHDSRLQISLERSSADRRSFDSSYSKTRAVIERLACTSPALRREDRKK